MKKYAQDMYADMLSMYMRLVQTMKKLEADMKADPSNMELCADAGFVCKEMDKLLKDIGVEVRRRLELAENLVGVAWLQQESGDPVRTEHCTASVDLKMQPKVPKKDTPEFVELMKWLGFDHNLDVVRLHWPTFCDLATKRIEEGHSLPMGMTVEDLHHPKAVLRFHKRKEVNA